MRASLILGLLCVASVAMAAPAEWTLPTMPADWKDVTDEMMKQPALVAQKETIIKAGGTFDAKMYMSDAGGGVMVVTSVFADSAVVMAELNGFMEGSRKRAARDGKEVGWDLERTPTMLVGTQRLVTQDTAATTKTFIGYNARDELRAIAFFCYGDDAVCGPLLTKATVDTQGMQLLAELDANKKQLTPRRIGWIVGGVLTTIFVLGALWKRRPRAPK